MNPKAGKEFLKIGIRCPFPLDDAAFILKLIHALLCRILILNFSFLSKCWCLQLFLLMVIVSGSDTMEGPQEGMRLECAVQEHGGGCLLPRTRVLRNQAQHCCHRVWREAYGCQLRGLKFCKKNNGRKHEKIVVSSWV